MTFCCLAALSESYSTSEGLFHSYKEFSMTMYKIVIELLSLFWITVFYCCGLLGVGIIWVHFNP